MWLFIIGIILGFIGILWVAFAPKDFKGSYGDDRYPLKVYGFLFLIVAFVAVVLSSLTIVGTRNVGVETVFGKPTGENYDAGLHIKAPWAKVTDIEATVQPEEYKNDDAIYVKIADGGTAQISVSYRWRIKPENANIVYQDYRKCKDGDGEDVDDAIYCLRKGVVSTNIKASINEVFGEYEPLAGVELKDDMSAEELSNVKVKLPDLEYFNTQIENNVATKIGDLGELVEIQAVTVSYVKLPGTTQDRINAFNTAVANVKVALAEVATKEAQAQGNEKLAESLQDPNVLVSKCFDALAAKEFNAPPGFSCWPGSNGSIVLPATK